MVRLFSKFIGDSDLAHANLTVGVSPVLLIFVGLIGANIS